MPMSRRTKVMVGKAGRGLQGAVGKLGAKGPVGTALRVVGAGASAKWLMDTLLEGQRKKQELEHEKRMAELEGDIRSRTLAAKMEQMRNNRAVEMNMMRLQQGAPDVYQELMSGRKLAPGQVTFGGRPRTDLVRMAAEKMGRGEFKTPEQIEQEQAHEVFA